MVIAIILLLLWSLFIWYVAAKNTTKSLWDKRFEQIKNDYEARINEETIKKQQIISNIDSEIDAISNQTEELKKEQDKQLAQYKELSIKNVETELSNIKKIAMMNIDADLEAKQNAALSDLQQFLEEVKAKKESALQEINDLAAIINDYKMKQDIINQDIHRQREKNEMHDYYRVALSEETLSDIEVLNSIKLKLTNAAALDIIIYNTYISKPVNEMIKRVLKGKQPSGIYKITNLITNEVYIGKSTNIKERWIQHAKTAFNCGTIARSVLHTTIAKYGLDNFTFEVLEECDKADLSQREHYWIEFYGSKTYGLNEKS